MSLTGNELPTAAWIVIVIICFVQGTWLFLDARKKRLYPWFWGIWGLTGFPTPLVVYFIVTRIIAKRRQRG